MDVEYRFLNSPHDVQDGAWVTARKTKGAGFTPRVFSRYLVSEHSPIRRLVLAWRFRKMERRASSHFVRHVHSPAFVGGSRPDWFENAPDTNDHLQDSNCQALIDLMRKRLCFRPWKATREAAETLKRALMTSLREELGYVGQYYRVLGRVLVPNCVYRCGCPEGKKNCGFFQRFVDEAMMRGACLRDFLSIERRYELFNTMYFGEEGERTNG